MQSIRKLSVMGLTFGVALGATLWVGSLQGTWADKDPYVVEFSLQPLRANTVSSMSVQANFSVYGLGTPRVNYNEMRQTVIMEAKKGVATKFKVSFGDIELISNVNSIDPDWAAVSRKAYLVEKKDNAFTVTDLLGKVAPKEEAAYVTKFMSEGSVPPIALLLHGKKMYAGDELKQVGAIKTLLEDKLGSYGIGKIKNLRVGLMAKGKFQNKDTAIFMLRLESDGSKTFEDFKMKLEGQLVVAVPSGLPIALKLNGPATLKYEYATTDAPDAEKKKVKRRGTFNLIIQTQTDTPKDETEIRRYYHGDDLYYIPRVYGGGRGRGGRAIRGGRGVRR